MSATTASASGPASSTPALLHDLAHRGRQRRGPAASQPSQAAQLRQPGPPTAAPGRRRAGRPHRRGTPPSTARTPSTPPAAARRPRPAPPSPSHPVAHQHHGGGRPGRHAAGPVAASQATGPRPARRRGSHAVTAGAGVACGQSRTVTDDLDLDRRVERQRRHADGGAGVHARRRRTPRPNSSEAPLTTPGWPVKDGSLTPRSRRP